MFWSHPDLPDLWGGSQPLWGKLSSTFRSLPRPHHLGKYKLASTIPLTECPLCHWNVSYQKPMEFTLVSLTGVTAPPVLPGSSVWNWLLQSSPGAVELIALWESLSGICCPYVSWACLSLAGARLQGGRSKGSSSGPVFGEQIHSWKCAEGWNLEFGKQDKETELGVNI